MVLLKDVLARIIQRLEHVLLADRFSSSIVDILCILILSIGIMTTNVLYRSQFRYGTI
jgi:hypothetical protein